MQTFLTSFSLLRRRKSVSRQIVQRSDILQGQNLQLLLLRFISMLCWDIQTTRWPFAPPGSPIFGNISSLVNFYDWEVCFFLGLLPSLPMMIGIELGIHFRRWDGLYRLSPAFNRLMLSTHYRFFLRIDNNTNSKAISRFASNFISILLATKLQCIAKSMYLRSMWDVVLWLQCIIWGIALTTFDVSQLGI